MRAEHVYIHVPFCGRRCVYCDFAIAVRRTVPVREFADALRREVTTRFADTEPGTVRSIYMGGGTPSRLGGEGVAQVLDLLRLRWVPGPDAEVTIEANPEDVTPASVRAWREAGVNRVSLGVQSFHAGVLTWMHRTHDPEIVKRAAEALRQEGIENWSLDLIYALPREVERDWERDLESALALAPPHISAYGLTVEEGTPLGRWQKRGSVRESDESEYEAEFLTAHDRLGAAGYEHYEVSNYARPGLRAVHNSAYWTRVPYVGLGPSAHEFDGVRRRWNQREYTAWLHAVNESGDPMGGDEVLPAESVLVETVYLALRTTRGLTLASQDEELVQVWVAHGWAEINDNVLRLTALGWLRLDALVAALTKHRSRY